MDAIHSANADKTLGSPETTLQWLARIIKMGASPLDVVGKYSILVAIGTFLWNSTPWSSSWQDRRKQIIYEAWIIIGNASRTAGSGGVSFALSDLIAKNQSLEGISLNRVQISGINFSMLSNRSLNNMAFNAGACRKCDFSHLQMTSAQMSSADFSDSRFVESDLRSANLSRALVQRTNLDGADFEHANLSGADLSEAHGSQSNFSSAAMDHAILASVSLESANFSQSDLSGAIFSVQVRGKAATQLRNSRLRGANLRGADLSNCSKAMSAIMTIAGMSLPDIDKELKLMAVNLSDADLLAADFTGADMQGANLTGAKMGFDHWLKKPTNLSGANLGDVVGLTQQQVDASVVDDKTILPKYLTAP